MSPGSSWFALTALAVIAACVDPNIVTTCTEPRDCRPGLSCCSGSCLATCGATGGSGGMGGTGVEPQDDAGSADDAGIDGGADAGATAMDAGSSTSVRVTFMGRFETPSSLTSYQYQVNVGPVDRTKFVVVAMHQRGSDAAKRITEFSIDNQMGTRVEGQRLAMAVVSLPQASGTKALRVTYSSPPDQHALGVWVVTGARAASPLMGSYSGVDQLRVLQVQVPSGGLALVSATSTSGLINVSNALKDYDVSIGAIQGVGARVLRSGDVAFSDCSSMTGYVFSSQ